MLGALVGKKVFGDARGDAVEFLLFKEGGLKGEIVKGEDKLESALPGNTKQLPDIR